MRKLLTVLAVALLGTITAFGATIPCSDGVANVAITLASGADTCFLGPVVFGDFMVSGPTGTVVSIKPGPATQYDVAASSANLGFQIAPALMPGQGLTLIYSVAPGAAIVGVDIFSGGSGVTIINELVCAAEFVSFACPSGQQIAAVNATTPGTPIVSTFFNPQNLSKIWIKKDISVAGAGAQTSGTAGGFSDFTNSHHVPEPLTFVLMGSGLLALGLLRRKRNAA